MIQLTPQERISERIVVLFVVFSVPQIQEQIVEIASLLSGADSAAHWGQIVYSPVPQVVEEIVEERDSLRIGGWWFARNRRSSRKIPFLVEVKKFLVRRALVRDDPRSSSSSRREVLMAHLPASLSMSRLAGPPAHRKCGRRQSPGTGLEAGAGAKVARTTSTPKRRHHCTVSLGARQPACQ